MSSSLRVAQTIDDATRELGFGARVVAGGTDIVVGARQGKSPLPDSLVAIHGLDELKRIEESGGRFSIGALVSHANLSASASVQNRFTALADACAIVGSRATRSVGTIGGNLMNASPAMETGGPLLCFGSTVSLRSLQGTRLMGIDELLRGPGQTAAASNELLESVQIPLPAGATGSCYLRLEYRRQMDIAVIGVTAVLMFERSRVTLARVAITALAPTVERVVEAEVLLLGTDAGPDVARTAARAIANAAKPISDTRASAGYRTAMAAVIGGRAIEIAAARAKGVAVPVPATTTTHGGRN